MEFRGQKSSFKNITKTQKIFFDKKKIQYEREVENSLSILLDILNRIKNKANLRSVH